MIKKSLIAFGIIILLIGITGEASIWQTESSRPQRTKTKQ